MTLYYYYFCSTGYSGPLQLPLNFFTSTVIAHCDFKLGVIYPLSGMVSIQLSD